MSCTALNSANILLFVSHCHQREVMKSVVGLHYNQCYYALAYCLLQQQTQCFLQIDYNLGTYFFLDVSGEHTCQ